MRLSFVQGVSLPRSGHNLLANLLENVFEQPIYCDYYGCCRTIPCMNGRVYQKHHDLDLSLIHNQKKHHLIQYRKDPQAQFNAYFRFFQKLYIKGDVIFPVQKHFPYFRNYYQNYFPDQENSKKIENSYDRFVRDHLDYYTSFIHKWIINNKNRYSLFVAYEDLICDPYVQLNKITEFFSDTYIAKERLSKAINSAKIGMKNDLKDSALYQAEFIERYQLNEIQSYLSKM